MPHAVQHYPFLTAPGLEQMARDEAMLTRAAESGVASLRFYAWSEPTLSLGYFQPAADRLTPPRDRLPWVRRATGGAALVHHHELTYAFALPAGREWQPRGESWICRAHHAIRDELQHFSVATRAVVCGEEVKLGPTLCFLHQTAGDLLCGGHKIAGSAQRKSKGALLQHGGVLLARSEYAPELPGLAELADLRITTEALAERLAARFAAEFGWDPRPAAEPADEIVEVAHAKFASAEWANKR